MTSKKQRLTTVLKEESRCLMHSHWSKANERVPGTLVLGVLALVNPVNWLIQWYSIAIASTY